MNIVQTPAQRAIGSKAVTQILATIPPNPDAEEKPGDFITLTLTRPNGSTITGRFAVDSIIDQLDVQRPNCPQLERYLESLATDICEARMSAARRAR